MVGHHILQSRAIVELQAVDLVYYFIIQEVGPDENRKYLLLIAPLVRRVC